MACACTHGIRLTTQNTICLDIIYSALRKRNVKKAYLENDPEVSTDSEALIPRTVAKKEKSNFFPYLCFFLAGIALNITWGAISFIVPYWLMRYDKNIWRDFVVCYNFPGFPILLLQLLTDEKTAKWLGTRKTYMIRLAVSYVIIAILGALVPYSQYIVTPKTTMLIFVTLVGVAIGLGHGWSYSIVVYYPSQAVSYLAAGSGASTVLLLIFTVVLDFPPQISEIQLIYYFEPVFIFSAFCIIFLILLLCTNLSAEVLSKVDLELSGIKPINTDPEEDSLLGEDDREREPHLKDEKPAPYDKPGHITRHIWSPLISIFVTIFTIVASVTLIAVIPSATNNPKFPVYILYVSSLCGFIGAEIAVFFKWMATPWVLFIICMIRVLFMPFLLFYSVKQFWLNDYFILAMIALFATSGAFCISKCYSLCSASVSLKQQSAASNWLNISLYVGIYVALAFPYILPYVVNLPASS